MGKATNKQANHGGVIKEIDNRIEKEGG